MNYHKTKNQGVNKVKVRSQVIKKNIKMIILINSEVIYGYIVLWRHLVPPILRKFVSFYQRY